MYDVLRPYPATSAQVTISDMEGWHRDSVASNIVTHLTEPTQPAQSSQPAQSRQPTQSTYQPNYYLPSVLDCRPPILRRGFAGDTEYDSLRRAVDDNTYDIREVKTELTARISTQEDRLTELINRVACDEAVFNRLDYLERRLREMEEHMGFPASTPVPSPAASSAPAPTAVPTSTSTSTSTPTSTSTHIPALVNIELRVPRNMVGVFRRLAEVYSPSA